MKTIGIIGAMDSEIESFCKKFSAVETKIPKIFEGEYAGNKVIISGCGIGKVNAAIAAQRLCDLFNVDYIINSGIAGGVAENIEKLDIVISEKLIYHDFTPLEFLDTCPPYGRYIEADKKLVSAAENACALLNQELEKNGKKRFTAHTGVIVSGDCLVTSMDVVMRLRRDFSALCTEMEGAAIAHVAKVNGVPFTVIRAISDFADEDAVNSMEKFEYVAADRAAFITGKIIESL